MKDYKFILIFIIILLSSSIGLSQKGFKIINKAETKFKDGKLDKSLKLLKKAERMNYGFCGNAWIDANVAINKLKAEIYTKKKKYSLARNSLDSIGIFPLENNYIDSLRILTYQLEIGADSLKNMIDSSLTNISVSCDEYECYVIIPLVNNKNILKLKVDSWSTLQFLVSSTNEYQNSKYLMNYFLNSKQYELIKNGS